MTPYDKSKEAQPACPPDGNLLIDTLELDEFERGLLTVARHFFTSFETPAMQSWGHAFAGADERWGEAIVALVELHPDGTLDEPGLIDHVKGRLARYKAPKRIHQVPSIGRAANGKLDYRSLRDEALAADSTQ